MVYCKKVLNTISSKQVIIMKTFVWSAELEMARADWMFEAHKPNGAKCVRIGGVAATQASSARSFVGVLESIIPQHTVVSQLSVRVF